MKLAKWDPIRDMMEVRDNFDRFVDNFLSRDLAWTGEHAWHPAVDILEDENNVLVKAEVPGVKKEDIKINLTGDTVTISGKTSQEKEVKRENYYRREMRAGSFSRSFTLPCPVDRNKATAAYKDGVLTVTLPKAEEAKAKEIQVEVK